MEAYLKPCEKLARYIQNSAIGHYSTIFRHIHNLAQLLHMQKPGILEILEYSELFDNCFATHLQNPTIFTEIYAVCRTLTYLKPDTYSEPSQRFKMIKFFAKILKNYNYFSKAPHLSSLTGSEYLSISTH